MSKQKLYRWRSGGKLLSLWSLLVFAVIFGVLSVLAMRQNNLTMISLRAEVFKQDKQNGDVETALKNLREYIYSHMNTNLNTENGVKPPIQLKYRYERLAKKERDRVSAVNTKIYNDAQRKCEAQYPSSFSGGPRVPCIKDYVSTHGIKENVVPEALYKFDFTSPSWAPDLAGWSLVAAVTLFTLFAIRLGLHMWVKHDLGAQM